MPPNDKYRGAVIEDLQLPPAFCLPSTESVSRAMESAYDRDFSHIPILNRDRRPLGYVDVAALKEKWEAGTASPNDSISKYMTKFNRSASQYHTLITPLTPLAELAEFLRPRSVPVHRSLYLLEVPSIAVVLRWHSERIGQCKWQGVLDRPRSMVRARYTKHIRTQIL
ncbi:uncharacterized protein BJ212DRAFT_488741 [Suillus subaureus]|uniref:CBS domain-containing protein n=1 Tax=Suillus subaureus TaxID=48587 RepID=A0A9P7E603_9AGAM|nr:uncharacterized protein BJ212DRAFT_488741 [Suillus subaureus]KAG1811766.1 hypothetical protein BJ212DRAFT_488741 [Suillus subaureus]